MELLEAWKKEDGLLTSQMASEIIGIDLSCVSRAVTNEKIKHYEFGKKRYLSFKDVLFYKTQREMSKKGKN